MVDTPGFSDSEGKDEEHIEEMMDVLSNIIQKAGTILLVLKGDASRFDASLVNMVKRMEVMFGEMWWNYLVIGVSFWSYSQQAIDGRACDPAFPEFCHDEHWYSREMTKQVKDIFGIERNFTFARY